MGDCSFYETKTHLNLNTHAAHYHIIERATDQYARKCGDNPYHNAHLRYLALWYYDTEASRHRFRTLQQWDILVN